MNITPEEQEWYLKKEYPNGDHSITRVFRCDNRAAHDTDAHYLERWRGMDDIQCDCGAWYNSFGQRLRDDWMGNPSNYDSEIGDMEGFEIQQLSQESHDL